MKTIRILLQVIIVAMLSSCSIEKRHYMTGYNVEWKTKHNIQVIEPVILNERGVITASSGKEFISVVMPVLPLTIYNSSKEIAQNIPNENNCIKEKTEFSPMPLLYDTCDKIYDKKNNVISARILEINPATIKYMWCIDAEELIRELPNSGVEKIVFRDGSVLSTQDISQIKTKIIKPVQSQYDILYTNRGTIKGQITEINDSTFKYKNFANLEINEAELSLKFLGRVNLGNGEYINRNEFAGIKNKLSGRNEIFKYTQSLEFKEYKIGLLASKAKIFGYFFVLPIIGLPADIVSISQANNALKYIEKNPELINQAPKVKRASLMAKVGVVLSVIASIVLIGVLISDACFMCGGPY